MPQLDHIIILVSSLSEVSSYKAAGFTVLPGGTHADGLTENALVVLSSRVYLELIAFCASTTKEQRTDHWWGSKKEGVIDWSIAESKGRTLEEEVGGNEAYAPPLKGGRRTPDGKVLQWEVVFPVKGERGCLPFYCSDRSPREWRVPAQETPHPNGAQGVHKLILLASSSTIAEYITDLERVLGASQSTSAFGKDQAVFTIGAPDESATEVVVREPANEEEEQWILQGGNGLYGVELSATKGGEIGNTIGAKISLVAGTQ